MGNVLLNGLGAIEFLTKVKSSIELIRPTVGLDVKGNYDKLHVKVCTTLAAISTVREYGLATSFGFSESPEVINGYAKLIVQANILQCKTESGMCCGQGCST
mgnify:CR=1 FL=1